MIVVQRRHGDGLVRHDSNGHNMTEIGSRYFLR
jgi:hypothetical protein